MGAGDGEGNAMNADARRASPQADLQRASLRETASV